MPGDSVEGLDELEINIDIEALAAALLANDAFVRKLAILVRNMLLKNARPYLNIFGKYAGGSQSR
jgi:hypothetical protein